MVKLVTNRFWDCPPIATQSKKNRENFLVNFYYTPRKCRIKHIQANRLWYIFHDAWWFDLYVYERNLSATSRWALFQQEHVRQNSSLRVSQLVLVFHRIDSNHFQEIEHNMVYFWCSDIIQGWWELWFFYVQWEWRGCGWSFCLQV